MSVSIGDRLLQTLSIEDMVLLLCVHGSKHGWPALQMVGDLDGLICRHPNLNWEWTAAQAEKLRSVRLFSFGLYLARELFCTPLPENVANGLHKDPAVAALVREVKQQLFQENKHNSEQRSHAERLNKQKGQHENWVFYLKARERLSDRIRVCLGLERIPEGIGSNVFPWPARCLYYLVQLVRPKASDREWLRLPARLDFFYYLLRPVRLAVKGMRRIGWRVVGRQ
jgi:hypothetical protein